MNLSEERLPLLYKYFDDKDDRCAMFLAMRLYCYDLKCRNDCPLRRILRYSNSRDRGGAGVASNAWKYSTAEADA
jgi:hypothetical protein